jgi:uncharacterized protein YndB with AHSA1/START domain
MEQKTKIIAHEGKHDIMITREFDLPLELLFKGFTEPELIEQWMGTKVLKLENKKFGGWQYETIDPKGNKHGFSGVIHEFTPNQKIIRTFEMANTPYGVQLEITEFEKLTDDTSKINMHTIYESVAQRDEVLKLPFAKGINWAHNRMEELLKSLR